MLPVELVAELEEAEKERRRARRRPFPWALRGDEVALFRNLSSTTVWDNNSLRYADLENFNAVRLWLVPVQPGSLTFYVGLAYAELGPWFRYGTPDSPSGRLFQATDNLAIELTTGARFVRVEPVSVSGVWHVLATPYFLSTGPAGFLAAPTRAPVETRNYVLNVDITTTGVKLSYVVPAGRRARVTQATWSAPGGTTQLEFVPSGQSSPLVIASGASINQVLGLALTEGDTVRFNVTTAGTAGQTGSGVICVLEMV